MADICAVEQVGGWRVLLTAVVGGSLCLFGLIENLIVFGAFTAHRSRRHHELHYLIWLAVCDTLLCLIYFPLVAVGKLRAFWNSVTLMRAWWTCAPQMLMVAQLVKVWSGYLVLAAAFERYLYVARRARVRRAIGRWRSMLILITFLVSVTAKGPVVLEIRVIPFQNCTGLSEFSIDLAPFARNFAYGTIYRYYYRTIMSIFIPFCFMAYFYSRIVWRLRKQERRASELLMISTQKIESRRTTRMLVFLVASYLATNALNVLLTTWEFVNFNSLRQLAAVYAYCSDAVSVLSVLGCCLRAPIYVAFMPAVRALLTNICLRCEKALEYHCVDSTPAFEDNPKNVLTETVV